jgi:TPR repeat protein
MYLCAESRCAPGVARDLDEAQYWLKRAAAQGSMVAAYQLAWLRGEARPTVAAKRN